MLGPTFARSRGGLAPPPGQGCPKCRTTNSEVAATRGAVQASRRFDHSRSEPRAAESELKPDHPRLFLFVVFFLERGTEM